MLNISIVILTYKRKGLLIENLSALVKQISSDVEIIIVDNCSEDNVKADVSKLFPYVKVIELEDNVGTKGRNIGISAARGDVVVTLDDDVFGFCENNLHVIREVFSEGKNIGALCFSVVHAISKEVINWCHHCDKDIYYDKKFKTYEITEGAVAINRDAFICAGGYPESFFISHEGPELALRLMNRGFDVIYSPEIQVLHHQSTLGRPGWRRYYYDTRNTIWLALRNYPLFLGLKFCTIQLAAMLIYSVRDGFFKYWVKGIFDSLKYARRELGEREVMTVNTIKQLKDIARNNEGLLKKIKRRFFSKNVSI